ncbi:DUF4132 domain-containing protein [Roseivirga sp.]|uniref:DUF4132 domain-containing protein n=1 Tax=Roseivirga sp. TaxID=1964215 RepID=UPI003B524F30
MAIRDFFNKLLRTENKPSPSSDKNTSLDQIARTISHEIRSLNSESYYSTIKLGDSKTYNEVKKFSDQDKIDLILHLPNTIFNEQRRFQGFQKPEARYLNTVREHFLSALLRQKILFTDTDLIEIMDQFKCKTDDWYRFSNWPIGLLISQLVKHVNSQGMSNKMCKYLKSLLKEPQFDISKGYWGADVKKAKIRIEELIFEYSNSESLSSQYELSTEDKFGKFANSLIGSLQPSEAQYWHRFFFHAVSANGGKPSKKYLSKSKEIINSIGNQKFKDLASDFLSFIVSLKAEESRFTESWNGREYQYSKWIFLEEKNAILLKGLCWSLVQFHDSKTISLLADLTERCFKKIPGVGPAAAGVGNAAIYTLANSKGLEGVSQLSRLRIKITQNNTKKLIDKYLDEASSKLGITQAEIEEMSIPDFGLMHGRKEFYFEDFKLEMEVTGVGKVSLTWVKSNGQIQKTTPAFIKKSKGLSDLLSKAKAEAKKIQKYSTAQRDRIDRCFILDRTWSYDRFEKYYLNHGLVSSIAQKLIWTVSNASEKISCVYVNGSWISNQDEHILLNSDSEVKLWHPIFDSPENVLLWRDKIEKLNWQQPVKQAYREIYILTDAEINTRVYSNRMAAHILKQHQFNALTSIRNWKYQLMGAFDDGRDNEIAKLALPTWGLVAEYWINELFIEDAMNDTGIWDYIATDQIRFMNSEGHAVDLVDVPKIVLSEVLRDADLFVGVASIGNDPAWQDSGGLRTVAYYNEYWTQYSFGDLNELAKTRKQVLERLLPRLKIKNVATIDGRFLRVKGSVREYKIHIGSTNILMEPNDQYLCIVPASNVKESQKDVYLPFEGDRGLSLILSKAFLLADDHKIEDQTILNQIHR